MATLERVTEPPEPLKLIAELTVRSVSFVPAPPCAKTVARFAPERFRAPMVRRSVKRTVEALFAGKAAIAAAVCG